MWLGYWKHTLQFTWQDPMLSESLCLRAVFSATTLSKYSYDLAVFFLTEHLSLLFLQELFKAFIYGKKQSLKSNGIKSNVMNIQVFWISSWFLRVLMTYCWYLKTPTWEWEVWALKSILKRFYWNSYWCCIEQLLSTRGPGPASARGLRGLKKILKDFIK